MCQTAEAALAGNIAICMVRGCNTAKVLGLAKEMEKEKLRNKKITHRMLNKDMTTCPKFWSPVQV